MLSNTLKFSLVFGCLVAAGTSMAAPGSTGGSGKITFTGEILDAPCSIAPESADQTVDLGQISNHQLNMGGKSEAHPFSIKLQNCALGSMVDGAYDATAGDYTSVSVTFTGGTATIEDGTEELFAISGSASGAGIAITDSAGDTIENGVPTSAFKLLEGDNELGFNSYMQSLYAPESAAGSVTPGDFQSVVNFTLTYA